MTGWSVCDEVCSNASDMYGTLLPTSLLSPPNTFLNLFRLCLFYSVEGEDQRHETRSVSSLMNYKRVREVRNCVELYCLGKGEIYRMKESGVRPHIIRLGGPGGWE